MPGFDDEDTRTISLYPNARPDPDVVPFRRRGDDELRPAPPPLPWISIEDWDQIPVPEQDWIVRNRFPRKQCALFSGEGAAGKSTLQLQLCAAHSLARD